MTEAGETAPTASTAPPGHESRPVPGPESMPAALDTDDTRGWHFHRLLHLPLVRWGGALLTATAALAAGIYAGPAGGAVAALAAVVLVLIGTFWFAASLATKDFFKAYASSRSLSLHESRGRLPAVTPLLREGDRRYCSNAMSGRLPGGLDGTLARYTYEVDSTDSDGDRQTSYHHFNVVLIDVPESAALVRELYVERRSGFRFLDGAEDVFRRRVARLELESEALDKRYEIFHHSADDLLYMHELFTPKFIVWLAEEAPDDFAFEMVAGTLCVNTTGHYDNAVDLDRLCSAAAGVRGRLVAEAAE